MAFLSRSVDKVLETAYGMGYNEKRLNWRHSS